MAEETEKRSRRNRRPRSPPRRRRMNPHMTQTSAMTSVMSVVPSVAVDEPKNEKRRFLQRRTRRMLRAVSIIIPSIALLSAILVWAMLGANVSEMASRYQEEQKSCVYGNWSCHNGQMRVEKWRSTDRLCPEAEQKRNCGSYRPETTFRSDYEELCRLLKSRIGPDGQIDASRMPTQKEIESNRNGKAFILDIAALSPASKNALKTGTFRCNFSI